MSTINLAALAADDGALTTAEVAALAGVTRLTVYRWCRVGRRGLKLRRLPGLKTRFSAAAVRDFLAAAVAASETQDEPDAPKK